MNRFLERYKQHGHYFDPIKLIIKPSLRVNTLKIDEKELIQRLQKKNVTLEKIPYLKHGYWYQADFSLGSTNEYLQGYYHLQEAASQIPAEILDPKENEIVLDMAAAPGSKTTHLAQLMNNKGTIIALDIKSKRLESLRNNITRLGVENVITYNKDAKHSSDLNIKFDKILLDAPCSGNFIIDKDWFDKREIDDFTEMSSLQKELIKEAAKTLKSGGTLIYSTCSLEPEEDEDVINYAIKNLDLTLEKIDLKIGTKMPEGIKLWPHKDGTQGFFIAKLKKP